MGFFDKRSDTEKEIEEYYKNQGDSFNSNYNNNTYNTTQNINASNKQPKFKIEIGTAKAYRNKDDNSYNAVNTQYDQKEHLKTYNRKNANKKSIIGYIVFFLAIVITLTMIIVFNTVSDRETLENLTTVMMIAMLGMFAVIGFGIAFGPMIKSRIKKRSCKHLVRATIIDVVKEYRGDNKYRYYSTYQYYYRGIEYAITTEQYKGFLVPKVGDQIDMFINESDPEDYYIEQKEKEIIALVFGLIFAIVPTLLIGTSLLFGKDPYV